MASSKYLELLDMLDYISHKSQFMVSNASPALLKRFGLGIIALNNVHLIKG